MPFGTFGERIGSRPSGTYINIGFESVDPPTLFHAIPAVYD
jgi:hypothetical protein